MLVSRIDKLLAQTAENTNQPPEIVADVIKHLFEFIKDFLLNPTHAGLRINYLGVIRPKKKILNFHVKRLLDDLRKDKSEENITKFRAFWNLRRLLQKDTERRNYKKRYGTWHFK